MPSTVTLGSWPQATGFDTASYLDRMKELFQFMIPDGILPSSPSDILGAYTNEMLPFGDSSGMQVKVYQGRVFAKGFFAKINDADAPSGYYTLSVAAAHATLYRLDTIIVRYDLATGVAVLRMLDGTAGILAPGPQPTPPTNSAATWDIVIGYVFVAPGVLTITANDVRDLRVFSSTLAHQMGVSHQQNPFTNSGCKIAQRGTTFASAASGTYGIDTYNYAKSGAIVHTLAQLTDSTLATALLAAGQAYASTCYAATVSTADPSLVAGDAAYIFHIIEGSVFEPYYRGKFTHRFWVRDTTLGKHAVAYQNSGQDRSCVMEYEIFVADTWEEKIIHVPAPPNAGTWDFSNGTGLRIFWPTHAGTSYGTAPGSWQVGNFVAAFNADGTTIRTVNGVTTVGNNLRLYGSNMAPGNYCPPFYPRPDPFERMLAQRRYALLGGLGSNPVFGQGNGSASGTGGRASIALPVPMRIAPTGIDTTGSFLFASDTNITLTAVAFNAASPTGVEVTVTAASGITLGRAYTLLGLSSSASIAAKGADPT